MVGYAQVLRGEAVQGTPRKTLEDAHRHIDRADEHIRASLERVASGKNRVVASLVRIAQLTSRPFGTTDDPDGQANLSVVEVLG